MSSPLDVVGIGSMVVDRIHRSRRILGSDEKGVLERLPSGGSSESHVGGVVLNHLGWAAVLGLRVGIFGRQADDAEGRFLRSAMDRLGIEQHLVLDGSASSTAEIFVDAEGNRAIYMAPAATAETTPAHVREHHAEFVQRAARVTTEVSQLPLATVREVLAVAREAGVPTVLDLDVPPSDAVPGLGSRGELEEVLRAADLIKPAKAAARELVGGTGDAEAVARTLHRRTGAAVVMTEGEAGCVVCAEGFVGRLPACRPKQVVDTTGAGDAFLGGLLAGLHHGLPLPEAALLANACGAACVEQLGAFPRDARAARERVLELHPGRVPELGPLPGERGAGRAGREALAAFGIALEELERLRGRLDPDAFERATLLVREAVVGGGRVHVTGVGKPEHVARYAASLLASTGTPATFLHATETVHGSAGQVVAGDVVVALSNSGETPDLRFAVQTVRGLGARVIGVTGASRSWLAREADVFLDAGVAREGGGLGLAPRASVAAELLVLAALSAALESATGLTLDQYHARHPAGALGARSRPRPRA